MRFVVTFKFDNKTEKKLRVLARNLVEAEHWARVQLNMWKCTAEFDIAEELPEERSVIDDDK